MKHSHASAATKLKTVLACTAAALLAGSAVLVPTAPASASTYDAWRSTWPAWALQSYDFKITNYGFNLATLNPRQQSNLWKPSETRYINTDSDNYSDANTCLTMVYLEESHLTSWKFNAGVCPADNMSTPQDPSVVEAGWRDLATKNSQTMSPEAYYVWYQRECASIPVCVGVAPVPTWKPNSPTPTPTPTPTPVPTPTPTPTDPNNPAPKKSAVRGDLDGNGTRDELMITLDGKLMRLNGVAPRSFAAPVQVPGDFSNVNWIGSPGDINNDGYQDAVMRLDNGDLVLYKGNGLGGFSGTQKIGNGWGQMDPSKLFMVPKFKNGQPSLLAVNTTNCNLYRYDFAADGTISSSQIIGISWCEMKTVFSNGDNTNDGISDIVGIHRSGDYLLYTGGAIGNIVAGPKRIGWGWNFVQVTGSGDHDGNGYDDVLARTASGDILVYTTTANGVWTGSATALTGWNEKYKVMQ